MPDSVDVGGPDRGKEDFVRKADMKEAWVGRKMQKLQPKQYRNSSKGVILKPSNCNVVVPIPMSVGENGVMDLGLEVAVGGGVPLLKDLNRLVHHDHHKKDLEKRT